MKNSKIVDRIRALLAKAGDSASTEDEALAAAERAQRMLEEHNLTMADVVPEDRDPHVTVRYDRMYADPWRRSIVFAVARYYGCRAVNVIGVRSVVSRKTGEKKIVSYRSFEFAGRPHAVEVCVSMCDYLFSTVTRLAREYSRVRSEYLGFERGCGESIVHRLSVLSSERRREEKKTQNTYGALVVQEAALLDAYCEKVAFVTGAMRARGSSLQGGAADDGWEAGKSVSLSEQVSGSSSAHLIGR